MWAELGFWPSETPGSYSFFFTKATARVLEWVMETRSNWKCKIVLVWNVQFYTHFPSERYFFVSHSLGAIKNKNLRRGAGAVPGDL